MPLNEIKNRFREICKELGIPEPVDIKSTSSIPYAAGVLPKQDGYELVLNLKRLTEKYLKASKYYGEPEAVRLVDYILYHEALHVKLGHVEKLREEQLLAERVQKTVQASFVAVVKEAEEYYRQLFETGKKGKIPRLMWFVTRKVLGMRKAMPREILLEALQLGLNQVIFDVEVARELERLGIKPKSVGYFPANWALTKVWLSLAWLGPKKRKAIYLARIFSGLARYIVIKVLSSRKATLAVEPKFKGEWLEEFEKIASSLR